MAQVNTKFGDIEEGDLDIRVFEPDGQNPESNVWVVVREAQYKGADPSIPKDEVIRRDVWATVKKGQAAGAVAGG